MSVDRTAIDCCKDFFGLSDAAETRIAGEAGVQYLGKIWQQIGDGLYSHPLYWLRQEWWHAYRTDLAPENGFFYTLAQHAMVLDYGCGTAEVLRAPWLERGGAAILVDISPLLMTYLNYKHENADVHIRLAQGYHPTTQVDAVVCLDVLEHIPHPMDLMRTLWSVLKPGGQMLVNFSTAFPHPGHLSESIAQFEGWFHWVRQHATILNVDRGGNIWLSKAMPLEHEAE